MGDLSKREARRRTIIEAMEVEHTEPGWTLPKCRCGASAEYEINRGSAGVIFVCAKHLPPGF